VAGDGEVVEIYLVGQDPKALSDVLETSQHAFDVWYRQRPQELHGMDVTQIRRRRLDPVFVWHDQEQLQRKRRIASIALHCIARTCARSSNVPTVCSAKSTGGSQDNKER
jgi:hypothetical protein